MSDLRPSGFFVLRTPALAFDARPGRDGLRDFARRPEVRDALAAASPQLAAAVEDWAAAPEREDRRLELTLARYRARMTGRATPFGLFAGWSTGRVGDRARLALPARSEERPHTRLDMGYLCALADAFAQDPALPLHPNPTLYETGGRLRYVEARTEGGGRRHRLVAADASPELRGTLARAAGGATRAGLARALVEQGADAEEAAAFVDELVAAQLLLPGAGPTVVGPEPARGLADALTAAGAAAGEQLERALDALEDLDRAPAGERAARAHAVAGVLRGLPVTPDARPLLHVDLHRPAPELELPRTVAAELARGLELLARFATPPPDRLARFRERFAERWQSAEVPLLHALDPESGIGLEDVAPEASPRRGARDDLLVRLALDAAAGGATEIDLDEHAAAVRLLEAPAPLPGAVAAMGVLAADSEDAVARGEFEVWLQGASGPSGARVLGRFCHADPRLRRHVEAHLREEEALEPDAVFAEIAHLPDGRLGNILARPALREHEIVLLAGSGAASSGRLALDDLLLSLEDDRLVLRSRALGRRVVPRLTSAHSFTGAGLALYRFLGLLQHQGVAGALSWDWGPLDAAVVLPRVRAGRVVLAPRRWRMTPGVANGVGRGDADALAAWRDAFAVPRLVRLERGESALPVDLDDPSSAAVLVAEARRAGLAVLSEWWPGPERMVVSGPGGRYAHELVVPFVRARAPVPAPPPRRRSPLPAPRRSVPPGGEWVYAKLYTGPAPADRVLREEVAPLVARVVAPGAATRWHFVRYADPEVHLRLRFGGEPSALRERVLPAVLDRVDSLVARGIVWRAAVDTYEREVERYGGPAGIELAEAVSHADSDAALALLRDLPADAEAATARRRLATAGVALLLHDLLDDEDRVAALVAGLRRAGPALPRRSLARLWRAERPHVEPLLAGEAPVMVLRERSARVAAAGAALRDRERRGLLTAPLEDVAAALAHMHLNRLLRHAPGTDEALVHDHLDRFLRSRAARRRAPAQAR